MMFGEIAAEVKGTSAGQQAASVLSLSLIAAAEAPHSGLTPHPTRIVILFYGLLSNSTMILFSCSDCSSVGHREFLPIGPNVFWHVPILTHFVAPPDVPVFCCIFLALGLESMTPSRSLDTLIGEWCLETGICVLAVHIWVALLLSPTDFKASSSL